MEKYKTIDLFAGIGGLRLGFERTGRTETVFSSEIDKFARKTYEANFGSEPFGDITKIEASDIPDHDILLAGFPCQAFSHAGLKKGFEDIRGTLFFDVARILKEKRPKAFLLENVLEAGKGFGYSLVNPESEYTRTLVAHYCKDGNEILLEQEGKNPRKLTERECARLQGFPEDFILPCSKTQTYKQLGNSVTVPVIYKIARKIIMKLDKDTK